jgi:hypothetical protein
MTMCSVEYCDSESKHLGLCAKHYNRQHKYGDTGVNKKGSPDYLRFWTKVKIVAECWEWQGFVDPNGYGQFYPTHTKNELAHIYAYKFVYDIVPEGLVIDHLCRNRKCVNPFHLEAVTQRVNTLRGIGPSALNAVKTHCPQGHPYDEANTWVNPKKNERICRECSRQRYRKWYKANGRLRNTGRRIKT